MCIEVFLLVAQISFGEFLHRKYKLHVMQISLLFQTSKFLWNVKKGQVKA